MPALPAVAVWWCGSCGRLKPHSPPTRFRGRAICRAASPAPNRRRSIGSALFDLPEFQIDRHRTAEDRHFHLEPCPLLVHFLDETVERRERTVRNADRLADLES